MLCDPDGGTEKSPKKDPPNTRHELTTENPGGIRRKALCSTEGTVIWVSRDGTASGLTLAKT